MCLQQLKVIRRVSSDGSADIIHHIRMIENLSHTSLTPDNGFRKAALLPPTHTVIKEKPGNWELDGMITRDGQRSKKKRQMNESDDLVVEETPSLMNEGFGKDEREHLRCWSYGCISVTGRRREMEDAAAVELGLLTKGGTKQYHFFGVYDGHGGSQVAHVCRERLHRLVVETVVETEGDHNKEDRHGGGVDWEKVMLESFEKMDEEVNRSGVAVSTTGSTAVVALVGEKELVVANCGDSRAVLSRGGVAVPLSDDHKPDRADELERIELSGGKVINWNGHRVLGVLATSRSIGDHYLKPFVIPVPQVTVNQRTNMDEFLIIASDGLWDVISNDVACHVVRRCLDGHVRCRASSRERAFCKSSRDEIAGEAARGNEIKNGGLAAEAASILVELAIARGSRDNISVVVVQLERPKALSCTTGGVGKCFARN